MIARPLPALRTFFGTEAAGGVVLIVAATLAMLAANLPATATIYQAWLHHPLGPMSIHRWIDDGLMTFFFLVVGLEIKRELVDGDLARPDQRRLPFIAAAAGMAVPALVYLAVTWNHPALTRGWAIPAATDIAFAIGVLALLGSRVPASLKLLLTTIAIADDMGAVAIIAVAYTDALDFGALAAAIGVAAAMVAMNRHGVTHLAAYLAAFALLWLLVLMSGIHATIAGVVAAIAIPIGQSPDASPLHRLEQGLHPWVAFAVVPLFGFANAGVALRGTSLAILAEPLVLGIVLGLFVGKQAGIFAAIWGADRLGIAPRPAGVTWMQLYGLALIAGIGFTMSLFIGALAFADPLMVDRVRIGVLGGSILSALAGITILSFARRP